MKNDSIGVIIQAFYGNRTYTEIGKDRIDSIILGCVDSRLAPKNIEGRKVIRIEDTDCVIVYNENEEVSAREGINRYEREEGYKAKPLAVIPELDLEIYSRCLMCRMDRQGNFSSITNEDSQYIFKYFAK